jgi:hypothetical protein
MSFVDGSGVSLFPLEFLKECIATYTKEHGKAPKVLVIAEDDYLDYSLSCTLIQAAQLNVKVTRGKWLKPGEIDLAMGIKGEEDDTK